MSCKHSRTYAVDTHDRIDCLDCDASWEGQDIVKLEANLALAVEALELVQSQAGIADAGEACRAIIKTARAALEKLRGEK